MHKFITPNNTSRHPKRGETKFGKGVSLKERASLTLAFGDNRRAHTHTLNMSKH